MAGPNAPFATLIPLARALGGDAYAAGRRANVPAPGHSAADRSVSLALVDGRVLVNAFGAADWREVLDDLRARGWIDGQNRLLADGTPAPVADAALTTPTRAERVAVARRLWDAGGPVRPGSAAALHLAHRAVDPRLADGGALRAHAAVATSAYRDRGPRRPALLAAVRDTAGTLMAVEITYLDALGRRCATTRPSRKVVGALPAGCAVRLARHAAAMLVGEGVFTTLSAMRRFGSPGWALLSTSNLRRWAPPDGVRQVLIAGDRGADGERSAALLRAALIARGVAATVALPPVGEGDWNDLDQEEARRKGG